MAFLTRYTTPADLPQRIPVFPLAGALLLPRAELPLNIFDPPAPKASSNIEARCYGVTPEPA